MKMFGRTAILFSLLLALAGAVPALAAQTYEGTLEVHLEDQYSADGALISSMARYTLITDAGERLSLSFPAGQRIPSLTTGSRVRATGERSGSTLVLQNVADLVVLSVPPAPSTRSAVYDALVLMVNFQDDLRTPITPQNLQTAFSGTPNAWYREVSYGQVEFTFTARGWFTLPISWRSAYWQIASEAQRVARAQGVPVDNYSRIIYFFPYVSRGYSGLGTLGGREIWMNGTTNSYVLVHELGHNFGLHHANYLDCGTVAFDPNLNCTSYEYGDPYDNMGSGGFHFNAASKEKLGWLPVQEVTATGTYALYPLALNDPARTRGLKIPLRYNGRNYTYYLEHRRAIGFDQPNAETSNGVLIHLADTDVENQQHSLLLDATPQTDNTRDHALQVGFTFHDPASGLAIHVYNRTEESIWVSIVLPAATILPAVQTSANSGRWYSDTGKDLWTAWVPQWAEYSITVPREGLWYVGVWAQNRGPFYNSYTMQLQVHVDGEDQGVLTVPTLTYINHYGLLRLYLGAGTHTLRLTWLNDYYSPGPPVIDANLKMFDIFVREETATSYLAPSAWSARSGGWIDEGADLLAFWQYEWVEYRVNLFEGDSWEIGIAARNGRKAPPPGFSFDVEVVVDGGMPVHALVPASLTGYHAGAAPALTLSRGYHTIRLRWLNDSCCTAGDANLQIHKLFLRNREVYSDLAQP